MSSPIQYAYMFERNKGPTKQLDALLRATAQFILAELGDKTETHLTPAKLAAFYKAVGGDYDAVFDLPHSSISCIWQVTGCQHCLLPEHDDFKPPSIPALTLRGFSRWQSLEILLSPEEHVSYMQYAVRNWVLKHPETGEVFPPDLPSDVFPTETDAEVDNWHKSVAEKLRIDADSSAPRQQQKQQQQAEPRFSYVRRNPLRPQSDLFGRPMSYSHIPARYGQQQQQQQQQRRPGPFPQQEDTAADERMRRRSFSDYPSAAPDGGESPPYHDYSSSYLDAGVRRSTQPRRRSHPRRHSSGSSDSDFRGGHEAASPPPPPRGFRRVPPSAPVPPPPPTTMTQSPFRAHRSELRPDEHKRRNVPSPLGSLRNKLSETVSNILPNGLTTERPRGGRSSTSHEGGGMHVRRPVQSSRLSHGFSDMDSDGSSDSVPPEALRRRRRMQEERERDRRGRAEWGDDRDGRRERPHMPRPGTQRRTSSHADADRHGGWERKWGT